MWPLERSAPRELLRLGACAAERWLEGDAGLSLVASAALPEGAVARLAALPTALRALYAQPAPGSVTLVLESAWLPLMLVDTGGSLRESAQVEALMRHRFGLVHAERDTAISEWDVRIDHRAGERWALGYGLAPAVRQALDAAQTELNLRCAALTPAWSWGWQRVRPDRPWRGKSGHWVWPEQDRMLLGRFEAGRPVGLNPATRLCASTAEVEQAIAAEALRVGLPPGALPIAVAAWQPPSALPASTPRTTWHALAAEAAVSLERAA